MIFRTTSRAATALGMVLTAAFSAPALAQEAADEEAMVDLDETVFDGDFLVVGGGVSVSPSYQGSDDYVFNVLPFVQGSLGGVDISPSAAGLKLDFVPDPDEGMGLDLGIAGRLRSDRARQITDDVVEQYGELDRAIEVGPTVGLNFPAVLNPYDSVSVSTDVMWDINGAHGGMVVAPSVSYFTPLSRSMVASLSVSAEWADSDYHDYYFRVSDAAYTGPAPAPLPEFEPQGGGFTSAGLNLLLGIDLDGNVANGGLGLIVIGGYSRVLGDAADTPFTSIRGTKDQFFGGLGIGYTF